MSMVLRYSNNILLQEIKRQCQKDFRLNSELNVLCELFFITSNV